MHPRLKQLGILIACLAIAIPFIRKRRTGATWSRALEDEWDILSVEEINSYIESELKLKNEVVWKEAPLDVLYSAVMRGNQLVTVGYGKTGENYSETKSESMVSALENVVGISREYEDDTYWHDHGVLNAIDLEVTRKEMLERLMQKSEGIRYLNPVGYADFEFGYDVA